MPAGSISHGDASNSSNSSNESLPSKKAESSVYKSAATAATSLIDLGKTAESETASTSPSKGERNAGRVAKYAALLGPAPSKGPAEPMIRWAEKRHAPSLTSATPAGAHVIDTSKEHISVHYEPGPPGWAALSKAKNETPPLKPRFGVNRNGTFVAKSHNERR